MAASQKILLGLIVLVLLAFPTLRYFGWPAVVGYIVGLVATTASLLYLLLFASSRGVIPGCWWAPVAGWPVVLEPVMVERG